MKKAMLLLLTVGLFIGLLGCTASAPPAAESGDTKPAAVEPVVPEPVAEVKPGEGPSMADAAYKAIAPVDGEEVYGEAGGFSLMDRFGAASDENSAWAVESLQASLDGNVRVRPYKFADGSTLTFLAVPVGAEGSGVKLKAIEITR